MKTSEQFLSILRKVTDAKTLEHLAIILDPVLTAADGVYRLGTWDGEKEQLVSANGDVTIDATDVCRALSTCMQTEITNVMPVRLKDLNTPLPRFPWMTDAAAAACLPGQGSASNADIMAIALVRSLDETFRSRVGLARLTLISDALQQVKPALDTLSEGVLHALSVRFTSTSPIAIPAFGHENLRMFAAANVMLLLHVFVAAAVGDFGGILMDVRQTVDLLDSCIPLGTKADDGTVLLLVE